jgi:YNFM family putative membrane transporter
VGALSGFLFGAAAMFATMYSTQAILPELGRSFDVSPARAGLTISTLVAAIAVGAWIWGPLSDRIGRRACLLLSCVLLVPVTLGTALAPGFEALLALRAVQGLCMPGLLVCGVPYVARVFLPRMGAAAMGWYTASLVAGGLVGRVGVALVAGTFGWRVALGVLAVLPLAAVLIMARTLPEEPAMPPRERLRATLPRGLRDRRLMGATMVGGSLFFAFVGVFSYIGFRLESPPFSYDPTVAGMVFLLWVLGAVGPFAGRWAGRVGWRRMAIVAVALSAAGLAVAGPDSLPMLIVGLALYTLGMFVGITAAQLGVGGCTDTTPGTAAAIYYSAYYVAGSLGAFLPGLAFEAFGWGGVALVAGTAMTVALWGVAVAREATERAPRPSGRERVEPALAGVAGD